MEAEPNILRLSFLGEPMAVLAFRDGPPTYVLEFDRTWLEKGHDLSPLHLPIERLGSPRVIRPGDTPFTGGLPGLIADSLPDVWGERMLNAEVPGLKTILGKLAAIGVRGPGGITFAPIIGNGADETTTSSDLVTLSRDAAKVSKLAAPLSSTQVNAALAHGGSSLGGAYPKTAAHLPIAGGSMIHRRKILIGGTPPAGHVPGIIKFSSDNGEGGGAVEFAFLRMAELAGIRVPRGYLVDDGQRRHFAIERFDRFVRADGTVGRRHVHTLSGLLHRRAADGLIDYEDYIRLARRLCGAGAAKECFRRAVFNLLSTNRDDHGRNHSFMYDEISRTWSLSPAYDLNPSVANNLIGLTWLQSSRIPTTFNELARLAEIGGVSAREARRIFEQVESAVFEGWPREAAAAGVPADVIDAWHKTMVSHTRTLRTSAQSAARKRRTAAEIELPVEPLPGESVPVHRNHAAR